MAALADSDAPPGVLPETAAVFWRPRMDEARLRRRGRQWTASTTMHATIFTAAAVVLLALSPLTLPVALICLAKAWIVPALYASRGATVLRPPRSRAAPAASERRALGLLGDLLNHDARALHAQTGLVLEHGELGVWLVGQAGAALVMPGGRRVHCWCVRVNEPDLPAADRTAHLLLALRADEAGFATVANQAFSGGRRRLRARLPREMRGALDRAGVEARRRTTPRKPGRPAVDAPSPRFRPIGDGPPTTLPTL